MKNFLQLDKLGALGLFLTAIFSPCCFPLFAFVASALGLGSFELFGGYTMYFFQAMVLISIIGLYLSYRKHKNSCPLILAMFSGTSIFYGYHFNESVHWMNFLYFGMFGFFVATILNFKKNNTRGNCDSCQMTGDNQKISDNQMIDGNKICLESEITCPHCGHTKKEIMPTNACQYFYTCENCKQVLKPKKGDCCVYCSYGSVKCPPIQAGDKCC